ncbi:MAG: hypothetical protein Pg6C_10510 [Treponemataceae bacterium]|nr:MAG: hypothetical protein Pg6C_10510 [Treponemataceae bacterium]
MKLKHRVFFLVFACAAAFCFAKEEIVFKNENEGVHVIVTYFGRMTERAAERVIAAKLELYDITWDEGDKKGSEEAARFVLSEFTPLPNALYLFELFEAGMLEYYFVYIYDGKKYRTYAYLGLL